MAKDEILAASFVLLYMEVLDFCGVEEIFGRLISRTTESENRGMEALH